MITSKITEAELVLLEDNDKDEEEKQEEEYVWTCAWV